MIMWKDIKGFEGLYQISDDGQVKSVGRYKPNHTKMQYVPECIRSPRINASGYSVVDLYKENKATTIGVHILVAKAFIDNPENKQTVNHIDGNKLNNNVSNLEWATPREQNLHFYRHGLKSAEGIKKSIDAMTEVTSKKVMCLDTGMVFESASAAARYFKVSSSYIMRICRLKKRNVGKLSLNLAYI